LATLFQAEEIIGLNLTESNEDNNILRDEHVSILKDAVRNALGGTDESRNFQQSGSGNSNVALPESVAK
jgi:hypothetical protein